ncbi:MAG TPA: hypothetical protein VII11_11005, partial [Bacteroidota bacterium]
MKNDTRLRELVELYKTRKRAIRARLNDFTCVPESEYFYELLYCLLTPQTSAEHAERAVALLKQHSFAVQEMDPEPILANKAHYIRFHKTKSKHVVRAKQEMPQIVHAIANGDSSFDKREWL